MYTESSQRERDAVTDCYRGKWQAIVATKSFRQRFGGRVSAIDLHLHLFRRERENIAEGIALSTPHSLLPPPLPPPIPLFFYQYRSPFSHARTHTHSPCPFAQCGIAIRSAIGRHSARVCDASRGGARRGDDKRGMSLPGER